MLLLLNNFKYIHMEILYSNISTIEAKLFEYNMLMYV